MINLCVRCNEELDSQDLKESNCFCRHCIYEIIENMEECEYEDKEYDLND